MTKMQTLKRRPITTPRKPAPHRRPKSRWCEADEQILVEHDLISQSDLEALRRDTRDSGASAIDILIARGVYTAKQIERCLATNDWLKRPTQAHIDCITAPEALDSYKHDFALNGCFKIEHFLPREELYALDLALARISLSHVDQDPKHKLHHSIGGSLLYSQQAMVNLNGHPALLNIAKAFLGDDLVQGKYYLKVDDPYQYRGMFGHTHAETHYDCLTRGLYMFLYMDSTGHDQGAFQIIPGSHEWYSRGNDGRTLYHGEALESQAAHTNKASLVHDPDAAHRWAGYESLEMPGNTLLVLSPFIWHAVRPIMHRRRLIFLGFFDASALTRDFVMTSDYFGPFPYELGKCDLSLLNTRQKELLSIHLDRDAWLKTRGK